MRKSVVRLAAAAMLSACACALFADDATIHNKVVRQRWPWSGKVDIDYVYTGTSVTNMSFMATWRGQSTPTNLVGLKSAGAFMVKPGQNRFEWNPADFGLSSKTLLDFDVQIAPVASDPRTYLVVDLVNGGYSFLADVPAGGWTTEHKTSKVVFRRIPAGTYQLGTTEQEFRNQFGNNGTVGSIGRGSTMRTITYTSDFYCQIFAFTGGQYSKLSNPSSSESSVKPATGTKYAYSHYRGETTDDGLAAISWPSTGHKVNSTSIVGKMRSRTSLTGQDELLVDLPTDAQWQLAMSAGTNTYFNVGGVYGDSADTILNCVTNGFWTKAKDGSDPNQYEVGLKPANRWGIYDFNVRPEPVLDWTNDNGTYVSGTFLYFLALPTPAVDPVGPETPSSLGHRLTRGGAANGSSYAPANWTLFHRGWVSPSSDGTYLPPRLVINLKPIVEAE